MLVGPGLPESSNLNPTIPQSIVHKNGRYSLVIRGLEHIENAALPIAPKQYREELSPSTLTIHAAERVFVSTSDQYMGTGLISHGEFRRTVTNNKNPGDVLKTLVQTRMQETALKFLNLKNTAESTFSSDRLVESRLYKTLCKVGTKKNEWQEQLSGMKGKALFEKKTSRHEYSIATGHKDRIYVHHRHLIAKAGCKRIKAGLDIISNSSIARLKPLKDVKGCNRAWKNEIAMFKLLLQEKNKGTDLEGLLKPRDILCFNKIKEGTNKPEEQTQVYVDRAQEDLADLLIRGGLPEKDKLKLCFQITKGLNTLHQLGFAHRDMKGDNVLIDRNGNALLCDFGFCRRLNDTSPTYEGSESYCPPEVIKNIALGEENTIHSGAWDSWGLGVVLFMIMKAGTGENAPAFYFDIAKRKDYQGYLESVKHYGKGNISLDTMEGVIDALLMEDPAKRLSVPEAFEAIANIYGREKMPRTKSLTP